MKRFLVFVVLAALAITLMVPVATSAATSVNITITATGSEVAISCNQTTWAIGTLHLSDTAITGAGSNWGKVTNAGSEAVDIAIYCNEMAGATVTWHIDDTGAPGDHTCGFFFSLDDGDGTYDEDWDTAIKIEATNPDAVFVDELATGDQIFGLKIFAPTVAIGNEEMTMGNGGGGDSGIVLTGSLD